MMGLAGMPSESIGTKFAAAAALLQDSGAAPLQDFHLFPGRRGRKLHNEMRADRITTFGRREPGHGWHPVFEGPRLQPQDRLGGSNRGNKKT